MFQRVAACANHYLLHLELYPTGRPTDRVVTLPGIDVTGDAGAKVGRYTIDEVVNATNNNLREGGFNYRFIAFEHSNGNFGIMLADSISGAAFAVVSGENSGGLVEGTYSFNVVFKFFNYIRC